MNTKLEEQLKNCQSLLPDQLSDIARSKLNETYQIIRDTDNSISPIQRKTNVSRTLNKWWVSTAAAAILGVTLIASGFVSPAMADALKQIPVLGQIYSLWGEKNLDPGLQQAEDFITNVNQSVTHGNVTMNIPTLLFDGTRILMNITTPGNRLASEPNSPPSDANKGAVDKFEVLYNGQPLQWGYEHMDGETASSIMVQVFSTYYEPRTTTPTIQFPDQFDLTVNVTLKGYDVPFQFVVPVTRSTPITVLTSEETKHHDNINLQNSKLEITPITTQLSVEYKTKPGQSVEEMLASIPSKYKGANGGVIALQYDIVDEHGVQLKPIGGHPLSESYNVLFEPFKTQPRTVTIKPYLIVSEGQAPAGAIGLVEVKNIVKEYIPELETVFSVQ
ncbi:DUF4179 domain-containing protein [Paenibacillus macquariensis]|uniref:DUF4179 domain-containing protein n=1 Tax=Paenibacillus macquariensis TaxID=948756 RepID=A0ABY1K2L6_9BACL|nr:DUF4179 domain-containing protein [Paenibacillus macquariensis]MEC0090229.1 DUF4179 domain-containing protein [Paenibacillus macquariensis]OAB39591.1 hypothetical protein PMSM_00235 [Paenibacillus macquariensis subsp. macquariensis]SIR17737.1 protein of unknown function [Paenibacillus macquariensis]